MKIFNKLLDWLFPYSNKQTIKKTLKDLDTFDTVWIKDKTGVLLKGWVYDINAKHILVTVCLENNEFLDFRFNVKKPLNQTQLVQGDVTLLLN